MKNFKALALTALTALTLAAPVQARSNMTALENCADIYRTAPYETDCYIQGKQGYQTVGSYLKYIAPAPVAAAPTVTYQRPTYEQFERKCNVYSNSYIRKGNYGNTLECISNGSSIATWSPTGYGF